MPTKNDVLIVLSKSDKTDFARKDFASQSRPQKVFSAIWALESEVNNGGFAQYFVNDSGETAGFVSEALEIIGAPKTADICRRAVQIVFPLGLPTTSQAISSAASEFSDDIRDHLQTLDDEFYEYPHDLTGLLFAYVASHPEEFGEMPKDCF